MEKKSFVTVRNIASQELTEAANYNFEASDKVNAVLANEPKKTLKKRGGKPKNQAQPQVPSGNPPAKKVSSQRSIIKKCSLR